MTSRELVSKMIHVNGGKILLVGENLSRMGLDTKHIIIWDDARENLHHKPIPSTIKVFVWTKFISHSLMNRLDNAVKGYHALKFPCLTNREIKELLSDFLPRNNKQVNIYPDAQKPIKDIQDIKIEDTKMTIREFLNKNLDYNVDYSVQGSKKKEQARLLELAKAQNFKTTQQSLAKSFSDLMKEKGLSSPRKPKEKKVSSPSAQPKQSDNSFTEFFKLIDDGIAAFSLAKEISLQWKEELQQAKELKEKLQSIFGK